MLLSVHQLRIIVANIIYYSVKAQIEKINDNDLIVYDLCVVYPLMIDALKKINVKRECAKMLLMNILFQKNKVDDFNAKIANLFYDVENYCADLFSGQPPELKTTDKIDAGILLLIIDLTKKNVVEKNLIVKTRVQMIKNITDNITQVDKEFAKEIIIHLEEVDDNFIRTLYHKNTKEQIELLQEWMPTKQLDEFFDTLKKSKTVREEYADAICNLYKKMNKKFDVKKEEEYTTKYYVKNVLPVIRLARKNYLLKHNLPEEDEFASYDMHIKFLNMLPTKSQTIRFSILQHGKSPIKFDVETTLKFSKVIQIYCARLNILTTKSRFIFDGTIDPEKTIDELKISNGAYVLCDYSG